LSSRCRDRQREGAAAQLIDDSAFFRTSNVLLSHVQASISI
jgi:hypothetical protein